jgi:hypothetical protein
LGVDKNAASANQNPIADAAFFLGITLPANLNSKKT